MTDPEHQAGVPPDQELKSRLLTLVQEAFQQSVVANCLCIAGAERLPQTPNKRPQVDIWHAGPLQRHNSRDRRALATIPSPIFVAFAGDIWSGRPFGGPTNSRGWN